MESFASILVPFGGFDMGNSSNGNQNALNDPPNQISRNNMTAPPSGGLGIIPGLIGQVHHPRVLQT